MIDSHAELRTVSTNVVINANNDTVVNLLARGVIFDEIGFYLRTVTVHGKECGWQYTNILCDNSRPVPDVEFALSIQHPGCTWGATS